MINYHYVNKTLLENAIVFLAQRYFQKNKFSEFIEILSGIDLPFATYFIAECYKNLNELPTPKKKQAINTTKQNYYLKKTIELLKPIQFHPLMYIVNKIEIQEVVSERLPFRCPISREFNDCELFLFLNVTFYVSLFEFTIQREKFCYSNREQ